MSHVAQAQAPAAPGTPAPTAQTAVTVVQGPPGVPQTREEVIALRAQRSELSNQLTSAARRRSELAEQLADASPVERAGLEARISQLDQRILEIEAEIGRTGQLIAQAPGELLSNRDAPTVPPFGPMRPDLTAISIVFTIFVLTPIAIAAARLLWKRANNPVQPAIDKETSERLRRLEGGIDAIAIEVERISEGQRFVTKLMAEREQQKLGVPRT
jgi:hypothetical protein